MSVGSVRGALSLGLGAVVWALVSGCGTPDPLGAAPTSGSARSTALGRVVSTSPTAVLPSPPSDKVPLCEDVPTVATDVLGSNLGGQGVDPALHDVINRYVAEHRDTFGGMWLDRDAGGTFVVHSPTTPKRIGASSRPAANRTSALTWCR
jgi:hypothetical protein